MVRNKFSIIVYAIIGLAIIGVISQLFSNPTALLRNILIMIGMSVVVFAVFYFVFMKKRSNMKNDEMKKYKQAVKQSQRKYKNSNGNRIINDQTRKQAFQIKRKNKRRTSHLRVIDGNGGKQNQKNEPYYK